MNNDYASYASEIAELEALLTLVPPENVLERKSLESRLQTVCSGLEKCGAGDVRPARAKLTFRGRPVVESRGMFADFASKAIGRFSEA
ncbi:MAG: hypothetical protein LBE84_11375 [Planctomycetota bacterium]|nr:hypothetical protein [Planctomycetota bacterium]